MEITTSLDARIDTDQLRAWVEGYSFGRYGEDASLPARGAQVLRWREVEGLLARTEHRRIVASSASGEPLGALLFRLSAWDTDHFGFPYAIVDRAITGDLPYEHKLATVIALFRRFDDWCRASNIRFVSMRAPASDLAIVHALERSGFDYIESWVYNTFTLKHLGAPPAGTSELRLAGPADCDHMVRWSAGAFATQRFHADHRFDRDKAESVYAKWIRTSFADPGQQVLALDIDGAPAAFMVYSKSDLSDLLGAKFAMWKLAVVNPSQRGRGLGAEFFTALLHHHRKEGLDVVESGVSIRNLASLNLHNKMRFKILSTILTFHRWLEPQHR